jgi:SnoaL-like domain
MTDRPVEERLQALEDEREILRTLYQYGHTLDRGPEDEFVDCFTENSVFEGGQPRSEVPDGFLAGRRFEGREAMRKFFRGHSHLPEFYHQHLALEPRVTLAGEEATVVSYLVRLDDHEEGPYIRVLGRYQDTFVRCRDGRWRIRERRAAAEVLHRRLMAATPTPWQDLPQVVR